MTLTSRLADWLADAPNDDGSGQRLALITTSPADTPDLGQISEMIPGIRPVSLPTRLTDGDVYRCLLAALDVTPAGRTTLALRQELRAAIRAAGHGLRAFVLTNANLRGSQLELIQTLLVDTADDRLCMLLVGPGELRDRILRRPALRALLGLDHALTPTGSAVIRKIVSPTTTQLPLWKGESRDEVGTDSSFVHTVKRDVRDVSL